MATTSFNLALSFSNTPNLGVLRAFVGIQDDSLELEGTYLNPDFQPPLGTLPGDPLGPGETDQPPYQESTGDLLFNHLALPRLTNQPSRVFSLSVDGIEVLSRNLNLSLAVTSVDWSSPINGISQGSIRFVQTVGVQLDPEVNGLTQGSPIEIWVVLGGQRDLLTRCFVLGNPKYDLNQNGEYELSLEVGDELALLSNTIRNRSKYCGLPPNTTQELAQIYARVNGLRTRVFPVGHDILEASTNNFLTETPFELLSAIYSPINRDVRTSPQGDIIFPIRPSYDPLNTKRISYTDVIESQNQFSQYYEPYTNVKASNNFSIKLPFTFNRSSKTTIQGNPENKKPWFQGGYTETVTTVTTFGDTVVHTLEETKGYIPLETLPWPKELVDEDPCAIGGFTTEFDVISRKITALSYVDHISGSKVVSKEETWVNGLEIFQIKDEEDPNFEDYDLYNGIKEYKLLTYNWAPQINASVCEKEYTLLITNQRTENYTLNDQREFVFQSWEQQSYTPSGSSSLLGQDSFTGVERTWVESLDSGQFNQEENIWVIQPTQINPGVNPPAARMISQATQDITNFSEFALMPGDLEPTPINAPFCYNRVQLNNIARRYLRENYGLSKAKVITVPWQFVLELGESVLFMDRDGTEKTYLVWAKETNITDNQVTKTYVLLKDFEGTN